MIAHSILSVAMRWLFAAAFEVFVCRVSLGVGEALALLEQALFQPDCLHSRESIDRGLDPTLSVGSGCANAASIAFGILILNVVECAARTARRTP